MRKGSQAQARGTRIRCLLAVVSCLNICLIPAFGVRPAVGASDDAAETVALWLFNEQIGISPSCVLSDHSETDFPLVLGPGGRIVPGKYGHALEPIEQDPITIPHVIVPEGAVRFGLAEPRTHRRAHRCTVDLEEYGILCVIDCRREPSAEARPVQEPDPNETQSGGIRLDRRVLVSGPR